MKSPKPPTLTRRRLLFRAGALALAPTLASAGAANTKQHTVTIEGMMFKPAQLSVKRGDRITWVNNDLFPHTVTADGAFDSQDIAASKSWSYVAAKAGNYAYRCKLHPTMTAHLVVT